MKYSYLVQQHFFEPYHLEEWPIDLPQVITAKAGSRAVGGIIQIQCLMNGNKVEKACFKAFGNPHLIATCSYTTRWLEGKTLQEIAAFDYKMLIEQLELPNTQQHCAIIINSAVEQLVKRSVTSK